MIPTARAAAIAFVLAASAIGCGSSSSDGASVDAGPDTANAADCPASLPTAATPCPVSLGSAACTYGCATGDPGSAVCRSARWVVGRTDVVCNAPDAGSSPIACGSVTCGGSALCVQPCCGGAAPRCLAKPDGGTCPAGSHETSSCGFGTPPGPGPYCQDDPCTPPAPYCSPTAPTGCSPDQPGSRTLRCQCA